MTNGRNGTIVLVMVLFAITLGIIANARDRATGMERTRDGFFLWHHVAEPYTRLTIMEALDPTAEVWIAGEGGVSVAELRQLVHELRGAEVSRTPRHEGISPCR
jgi:hypothetical protein